MRGRFSSMRAMAIRWRWPPETRMPPSPTSVSRPSGSDSANAVRFVRSSTSAISASVASGRAYTRFDRSVPASTGDSCSTCPMRSRTSFSGMSATSRPSRRTAPRSASYIRLMRESTVDFPAPDGPTSAVRENSGTVKDRSRSAGCPSRPG